MYARTMTSFVVTPSIDTFMRFGERVEKDLYLLTAEESLRSSY